MDKDDVTFTRSELVNALVRYKIIRDCIEQTVKLRGETYLPMPNPTDKSVANKERYKAYIERAIFYGVTGRTLGGMVGQVYARDPEIVVPTILQPVVDDATGTGLSLVQLSKDAMRDVMALGRGGVFVDYPKTEGPTTRAQQLAGAIRPTFTFYPPENIINWRMAKRGGSMVLALVVLSEWVDVEGAFAVEKEQQFRVLRLVDNLYYRNEVWKLRDTQTQPANPFNGAVPLSQKSWQPVEVIVPTDASGFPMKAIPFEFIGATNNDATVDEPPLYDLAELNIGHYRNSADYEEASFIVGQPTPWFSGLTEDWVENVFKGEVLLGSRAAVPLPENSQAGLLQVNANIMPMEAMKHKEAQMVALGARLVENRMVRRTYGEVKDANAAETSILASCANNVSAAFTAALVWAAQFMGASGKCSFKLNTEFSLAQMPPEERNALIADLQAGTITWKEARRALKRGGVASEDDDAAMAEIKNWLKAMQEMGIVGKPAVADKPPQP